MEFIRKFRDLANAGMFEWIEMFALGALLLAFIFAPALEGKFAPWKSSRNELAATGQIIRAISGILIAVMLFACVVWGP